MNARQWNRVAVIGLATMLSLGATLPIGCEKPRDKAQKIVTNGELIGVTIADAEKVVGKAATKHDDYNYYWDMGPGNGVIQVLVRGGKITRVDLEDQFNPRAARDNTVPEGTAPTPQPAPEGAATGDPSSAGGG